MIIEKDEISSKEVKRLIRTCLKEKVLNKCKECKRIYHPQYDSRDCPHTNLTKKERNQRVDNAIRELQEMGILEFKPETSHKQRKAKQ